MNIYKVELIRLSMSFFNDVLYNLNIKNIADEVVFNMVVGAGVIVVGNVKIDKFSAEMICVVFEKTRYQINGINMKIKSISKGEIVIVGNVFEIVRG